MGLDVPPAGAASGGDWSVPDRAALTPGLEALDEAAREIHRYGGWAMQADALPAALTPLVLSGPVDFQRDAATPVAVARALREGDAAPLAAALRAALDAGIEQRRCARGLDDGCGLLPTERGETAASLALRALGLPARVPAAAGERRALREACLFLLGWRIGLASRFSAPPSSPGRCRRKAAVTAWCRCGTTRRAVPAPRRPCGSPLARWRSRRVTTKALCALWAACCAPARRRGLPWANLWP